MAAHDTTDNHKEGEELALVHLLYTQEEKLVYNLGEKMMCKVEEEEPWFLRHNHCKMAPIRTKTC